MHNKRKNGKNQYMEFYKIIDNITLRALVFFLNAVWIQFFVKRLWASLIIAFSVTLLFFVILKKVLEKMPRDKINKQEIYKSFVLMPKEELKNTYLQYSHDDNYVFLAMRFSPASFDDVAAAFRESGEKDATILTGNVRRNVITFSASLDKKIKFVTKKDLYKLLKANNALPKIMTKHADKPPISPKEVLDIAFSGANAKYFAYSGILIAITALITPYRLYYGIMASVLIIFALISSLRTAQE